MPGQAELSPTLDHIVILISHETLLGLSDCIQHLFIVAPGGTHADGLTSNKLVLLPDGVYIEFIAFFPDIDPEKRRSHRWGNLKEGTVIDWAFTLPSDDGGGDVFGSVQRRVQDADAGFFYEDAVPGGRKKDNGTILKWAVSAPRHTTLGHAVYPGGLPFWCLDRTPRDLRVPYAVEPHLTHHPSGVQGVSFLALLVPTGEVPNLAKTYNAVFGRSDDPQDRVWQYAVPSGSAAGRHAISLSGIEGDETFLKLLLNGPSRGTFELLPGLVLEVE